MAVNSVLLKDRNFKFSGNVQQLVRCSAHRKEHFTVHYGWRENAWKRQNLFISLQAPKFGILFCLDSKSQKQTLTAAIYINNYYISKNF